MWRGGYIIATAIQDTVIMCKYFYAQISCNFPFYALYTVLFYTHFRNFIIKTIVSVWKRGGLAGARSSVVYIAPVWVLLNSFSTISAVESEAFSTVVLIS